VVILVNEGDKDLSEVMFFAFYLLHSFNHRSVNSI
jgi:hypothetical protein